MRYTVLIDLTERTIYIDDLVAKTQDIYHEGRKWKWGRLQLIRSTYQFDEVLTLDKVLPLLRCDLSEGESEMFIDENGNQCIVYATDVHPLSYTAAKVYYERYKRKFDYRNFDSIIISIIQIKMIDV